MNIVTSLIAFLFLLSILVAFHELGHFSVARYFGVTIKRFSVGLGPVLFRRFDKQGTEYVLSAIPLGGYVHFLDASEQKEPTEMPLSEQPVRNRIAITLAGPAFNFILAVVIYWGIFATGFPEFIPKLDTPTPHSLAEQAGFKLGDELVSIDNTPVHSWQNVRLALLDRLADPSVCPIQVKRDGATLAVSLPMHSIAEEGSPENLLDKIGFTVLQPRIPAKLSRVMESSPAAEAGVIPGDIIRSVDGAPVFWSDLTRIIHNNPDKTVVLSVERAKQHHLITVTLGHEMRGEKLIGTLGIAVASDSYPKDSFRRVALRPDKALGAAITQVYTYARLTLEVIGKMIIGETSLKNLTGPITIAQGAGISIQSGWLYYFSFMAIVSISLGVMNLLPIPLLDGGHLVLYAIETIRGNPLSARFQQLYFQVGMFLLFLLTAVALFNDTHRLLG